KEEDSITDVENAVFDLGVMDPLYGDHPRSQGQSLHASRPNRLCACRIRFTIKQRIRRLGKVKEMFIHYSREKKDKMGRVCVL
ncbi:hypothetical protein Tco_0166888, partial [Tanacetum coccineum]